MATLAVKIEPDVSGARVIRRSLDDISAAAGRTEDAVGRASRSTSGMSQGASGARVVQRSLNDVAKSADGVTRSTNTMGAAANSNFSQMQNGANSMVGSFRSLMTIMAPLAALFSVRQLQQYADGWSDMQSQVGAAIRDMEAAPRMMQRLVDIANASYSPLSQTVEVYSRNVTVLRDLGVGAKGAADFTEALNHALVLTATRGERAASVQNALSKAMAVGKLQADGLETVLANGGEVAQALADELGTTISGLRQMASDGKITGDVIANSLIKRLDDLRDRAGEMPATIGDAFVRIGTNLTAFVGQMDKAYGASETIAGALLTLADNIDRVAIYAATAATAFGTYYVAAFVLANASTLTLAGSLAFLRAALIRVGIGALIIAAGEMAYQFTQLVAATGSWGGALEALGNLAAGVWDGIGTSASAIIPALASVWERVKAGFYNLMADMMQQWDFFLRGLAEDVEGVPGMSLIFDGLMSGANRASLEMHGFQRAALEAHNEADRLKKQASSLATEGFDKARAAAAELAAIVAEGGEAKDGAADSADRLNRALANTPGAAGGASASVKELEQELNGFISRADGLAEKLFPGEYAIAEALELIDLLDRLGGKLTDLQRQAVEVEINKLFIAGEHGVRRFEDLATTSSEKVGESFADNIGDTFADIFSQATRDGEDFFDSILRGFAGLGNQLAAAGAKNLFGQLFGTSKPGDRTAAGIGLIGTGYAHEMGGNSVGFAPIQLQQMGREIGNAISPSISTSLNSNLTSFAAAIRKIESGSYEGNYSARGPVMSTGRYAGDRAYGAYQVMGKNIESWTKEAIGTSVSIRDFLSSKEIQDKTFYHKFGQSVDKFGTFADGASVWFSGQPLSRAGNRSDGFNTVPQYVSKAEAALAGYGGTAASAPVLRVAVKDGMADFTRWMAHTPMAGVNPQSLGGAFPAAPGAGGMFGMGGQNAMAALGGGLGIFSAGMESGSPLGGALSGAMGGFQMAGALGVAGPVGALIGAGIGLLGGLFGKSKKKKQELEQAKKELEQQMGAIQQLLATTTGNFMGEFQTQYLSAQDELNKAIELASKAKDNELKEELEAAVDTFFERLQDRWERGFDGMIDALNSGQGFDGAFASGMNAVEDMREALVGFVNDAKFFSDAAEDATNAIKGWRQGSGGDVQRGPGGGYVDAIALKRTLAPGTNFEAPDGYQAAIDKYAKDIQRLAVPVWDSHGAGSDWNSGPVFESVKALEDRLRELGVNVDGVAEDVEDAVDRFTQAQIAAQNQTRSMLRGGEEFSEMELELQRLQGVAATIPSVLQDLGLSLEEAAKAVEEDMIVALDKLREDFGKGMDARLNEASGEGYVNSLNDLVEEREMLLRDAAALGMSAAIVEQVFLAEAESIVDGTTMTAEALTELAETFPILSDFVEKTIADMQDSFTRGLDERLNAANDNGHLNQLRALMDERDELREQAADLGLEAALLEQVVLAEAGKIVDGADLSADALRALARQFPVLIAYVHEAIADMRSAFTDDLQGRLNRATGKGYLTELDELAQGREDLRAEAAELGLQTALLEEVFLAEARGIIEGSELTADALGDLAELFPDLATVVEETLADMRNALSDELDRSINELSGVGYLNQITDAQKLYNERLEQGALLGLSGDRALTELNLTIAQIARDAGLTQAELDQLSKLFPAIAGSLADALDITTMTDARQAVDRAREDLRRAYEDEAAEINTVIDRTKRFIDQIGLLRDDMRLNNQVSPLGPLERLQEAQRIFGETSALAMSGDEEAQQRLAGISQAYLDEARSYYASSEDYMSIWETVDNTLARTETMAGRQLSEAERQLTALEKQVAKLIDIDDSVMSVADAIANLQTAIEALDFKMKQATGGASSGGSSSGGTSGGGSSSAADSLSAWMGESGKAYYRWSDGSVRSLSAKLAQDFNARMGGNLPVLPGYAMGGYTGNMPTSSVAGYVHGQEFVVNAEATRRWRPQFEAANAGHSPFDMGAVVSELRDVKRELAEIKAGQDRQTSTVAQGSMEVKAAVERGNDAARESVTVQKRKAAAA